MVHVLIIGAAGMVGHKLARHITQDGSLNGRALTKLSLVDVVEPPVPANAPQDTICRACDFSLEGEAEQLVASRPDVIFHLAAIVSGEAEVETDKGYRINLDGTRRLFEAIRALGEGYCPRVVFTSSIAVFGAPFPDPIPDDFLPAPLTSYGAQKAMSELLLADFSRKGFLDGIGIRLPTIVVRPGKPNKAASGFFSGIIREPLNGQEAVLPVADDVLHWMASPRAAAGFLIHAAGLDGETVGPRRNMTMPGLAVTVAEEIETLRRFGGEKAVKLIRRERDPLVEKIVAGWPRGFDPARALALGFKADESFDAIVQTYIEEEGITL
ncbi:D-erythronate dehydrogenase [Roseibium suaedae]|uniref:Nucleoside-diphosphate-sugar epimerase n=1 Tax=Roseibium suaedae TaxID=735517 RepID=A0A1M7M9V2_9HYPH|nr:D-erythronate dehydrogenase [Roseibium suaedae]SHM87084.1 Nucleoside-diphosphate-sugar epimerase [Roseibium suaedae]